MPDTLHISRPLPLAEPRQASDADSTYSPVSEGHVLRPFHSLADTLFTQALTPVDTVAVAAEPEIADWHLGLEPEPRPLQPGNRSGFLVLIALLAVVMTFNFKYLGRVLRQYGKEVWEFRHGRENVFDERPDGDTRILILLLMQCVICLGILLCAGICRLDLAQPSTMTGAAVGVVIGICGLYYIAEIVAYNVVGYTFTTPAGRREWLRGFNASQGLLGILLIIPAVLAVFYPPLTRVAVIAGVALYLCARMVFIIKGFKIFYDNFSALLYFILYLCTLEIIPVIFVYECSRFMVLWVL